MSKTEELLKVLDMPEDEQFNWVKENAGMKGYITKGGINRISTESLADLAFRLTPEGGKEWMDAKILVWEHRNPEEKQVFEYRFRKRNDANDWFMSNEATAMDRVIAALIAKPKEKADAD